MEYARIVRRRLIVVLMAVTLAPVTSVVIAKQQAAEYQATASTLLNHINLGASLSGVPQDSSAVVSPDRALATEAALARTPTVADRPYCYDPEHGTFVTQEGTSYAE